MSRRAARHLAFVDAAFSGIATAVAIIEAALVASNPSLGAGAFEISVVSAIALSIVTQTVLAPKLLVMPAPTVLRLGYRCKLAAAILFAIAFLFAAHDGRAATWAALVMFLIADAAGNGCVASAFRPAYAAWYTRLTACQSSPDFLGIMGNWLGVRLGIPVGIMAITVAIVFAFATSASTVTFLFLAGGIVLLRLFQCRTINRDFDSFESSRSIKTVPSPGKSGAPGVVSLLRRAPTLHALLVLAEYCTLGVLYYMNGIIFRIVQDRLAISERYSWALSSGVAIIIFLCSSLVGYAVFPTLTRRWYGLAMFANLVLIFVGAALAAWAYASANGLLAIIGLGGFSIVAMTCSEFIRRIALNLVTERFDVNAQSVTYYFSELFASGAIAVTICGAWAFHSRDAIAGVFMISSSAMAALMAGIALKELLTGSELQASPT